MNYLITGGSGYLGTELIKTIDPNKNNIINIDINKSGLKNIKEFIVDISNEVELKKIFDKYKIDIIIHNVAKVPLVKKKSEFKKVNYHSTKVMLNLFDIYKIKKFIYISSSAVFGVNQKSPITEESKREPVEAYGITKKASEDLCFEQIKNGKNIAIIRPRTIIGLNRFGIFSILFDWIKNDLPVPVLSNGDNLYQFVDIRDLCKAIVLASESSFVGSLNIGSSDVKTIRDIVNFLKSEFKSKAKIKNIDNSFILKIGFFLQKLNFIPLQDYHFKAYGSEIYFDISKANKVLNWKPEYSTFDSFKDSYENFLISKDDGKAKSIHKKILKNFLLRYITIIL